MDKYMNVGDMVEITNHSLFQKGLVGKITKRDTKRMCEWYVEFNGPSAILSDWFDDSDFKVEGKIPCAIKGFSNQPWTSNTISVGGNSGTDYTMKMPDFGTYDNKCNHNWKSTKLIITTVYDCTKCGQKKEEL